MSEQGIHKVYSVGEITRGELKLDVHFKPWGGEDGDAHVFQSKNKCILT